MQELAAELAALGVRVSALEDNAATKDDIARLEAAIEELKAMRAQPEPAPGMDEAALADLADRAGRLPRWPPTPPWPRPRCFVAEQLDAVEERCWPPARPRSRPMPTASGPPTSTAVLLNQDVLSLLQDRVTREVEKQLAQLGGVDLRGLRQPRGCGPPIQEFSPPPCGPTWCLADRVSALDARVSGAYDQRREPVEGTRPSLTGSA